MRPRYAALVLSLLAVPATAAPLAEPALNTGEDIRREAGEVTVPTFGAVSVLRYTWRDSAGRPRSVSLVPASPATSGYAVQMTYQVVDGAPRTVYVNSDASSGDAGFGYFVAHELYRHFSDNSDRPIAHLHGEDDSPLGRYLPSTGSASSVGTQQAVHEYRLNYPRWGTTNAFADPLATIPVTGPFTRYTAPVVIRWSFVAGFDYPLWSVTYDLRGMTDHVASDVRGPYGVMRFNESSGPDVTALRWGDKYRFSADAGGGDFGAAADGPGELPWTWNVVNNGRRYNVLGSGSYEFGLVEIEARTTSRHADGYSESRNKTSATAAPCNYGLLSMPCDYEWSYQSFQYDYGPPARPKIAWGSSPFLGTSLTAAWNGLENIPLDGAGIVRYGVHIVYGRAGAGTPLTLARAAEPVEPAATLTATVSGSGSVSAHAMHETPAAPPRTWPAWSSVKVVATPAAGFAFGAWGGACEGVTGTECLLAMDGSRHVTASFVASGAVIEVTPASVPFPPQSLGTTSAGRDVTFRNAGGSPVTITGFGISTEGTSQNFAYGDGGCSPNQVLQPAASCVVRTFFQARAMASDTSREAPRLGHLTLTFGNEPATATLSGTAEYTLVTHFYRSILRREPDSGGKQYWTDLAERVYGMDIEISEAWTAMATQFFNSPEYQAFGRDDAGFVTDLYITFFNRAPDSGGLQFWTGQLAQGMPRGIVLLAFALSNEFRAFNATHFGSRTPRAEVRAVASFFRGFLGRLPDTGGYAYWINRFRAAQCDAQPSVALQRATYDIVTAFINSSEYVGATRTDAEYVSDLYSGMLRRAGELDGVQYFLTRLASGEFDRPHALSVFFSAPEYNALVDGLIAQGCLQ